MNDQSEMMPHQSPTHVLIVGATQGIGLGFVKELLKNKSIARIYATYRNITTAKELFDLQSTYSSRLHCLAMDITDESQMMAAIKQIQTDTNKLHLVINCVGILHRGEIKPEKSLKQINPDHLLTYFQVNSIGSVLLAKHLLPLLCHSDRSLFAAISAKIGSIEDNYLGGWYGYRASKSALNMLMRTVAIEYRRKTPHTIVVTLHPGTTDTRLSQPFQKNVPPEKLFSVERTVSQLLGVMNGLTTDDSGGFFAWDGSRLPY